MYSGTTLSKNSGNLAGVHQRIDRAARQHLIKHDTKKIKFPTIEEILYFEGQNGPDGLKRKHPSHDEPWHFIDPENPQDRALLIDINDHIYNLAQALRQQDQVKAAFESAWLAHAVVDGLTPAHHYPLGEKIEELWGKKPDQRPTVLSKIVGKGVTLRETISKNWQYIGIGGFLTSHLLFEAGVVSASITMEMEKITPTKKDFVELAEMGFEKKYLQVLSKIHRHQMYKYFCINGWDWRLARKIKKTLVPELVKAVSLAWSQAILLAEELEDET